MRAYDLVNHITYLDDGTSVCLYPYRLGSSFVRTTMDFEKPACPKCSSLLEKSLQNDDTQRPIVNDSTVWWAKLFKDPPSWFVYGFLLTYFIIDVIQDLWDLWVIFLNVE